MEIVHIRSVYQNLEKKNKELLSKLDELTKKNNLLSKENISLKYSYKEYNITDKNKIIDEMNKKIVKISNEKNEIEKSNKKLKSINNELIKEKNDLEKKFSQALKNMEIINKNMKEVSEIKDNYKDKYTKIEKELIKEKQKSKNLEKKLEEINDSNINNVIFFAEPKTRTYRNIKLDKINEIEMVDRLSRISHQSPQCTHKSISRFSTNNSTKKLYNSNEVEINPDNYKIVKQFKLNNLKWFLLKKIKKNILPETEGIQPLYRRYQYLKLNSKKIKEKTNEDNYTDYIWKANNEKDFINFNLENIEQEKDIIDNEKEKKIIELQICIKELKEKLNKKENDYNRINLNYAKLFKKTKKPEMTYDKLLEENDRIKYDNKLLKKKLEKIKENQNFIGISFIGDDLEKSNFIDDTIFENILDEITKNRKDKKEQEIITMKCFISNEDNKNKENIIQEYNSTDDNNKIKKEKNYERKELINNKIKKLIKKDVIKDILIENKKENDIIKIENKSTTNRAIKKEGGNLYEKIKSNLYYLKYHKSLKNTRNINTEIENENNNQRETYNKKLNQKSLYFDSNIKNKEKEKISKDEGNKESLKREGFIRRIKYFYEKKENNNKSKETK